VAPSPTLEARQLLAEGALDFHQRPVRLHFERNITSVIRARLNVYAAADERETQPAPVESPLIVAKESLEN